jgi:hypothetical protein
MTSPEISKESRAYTLSTFSDRVSAGPVGIKPENHFVFPPMPAVSDRDPAYCRDRPFIFVTKLPIF